VSTDALAFVFPIQIESRTWTCPAFLLARLILCLEGRALLMPALRSLSKTPLLVHETRGAILPVCYAQKLSPPINVELEDDQEVFGRYADSMTS
jgi:hypothetical protein